MFLHFSNTIKRWLKPVPGARCGRAGGIGSTNTSNVAIASTERGSKKSKMQTSGMFKKLDCTNIEVEGFHRVRANAQEAKESEKRRDSIDSDGVRDDSEVDMAAAAANKMREKKNAKKFQNIAALEACWLEIPGMRPNIKSIKGFTRISSTSTPIQVVAFLNDFFNGFDAIIAEHDAYKVETIGDAYMTVSGMPRENGNAHVQRILEIGLKMCTFVANFKLAHRPDEVIMVRIGFHSGTVAAGLVGLQAPRFCLFGETVNFASRMEFHGLPNKIQISEHPFNLLRCFYDQFVMKIEHGTVEIKGKGEVTTYFLEGKEQSFNLGKQSYGKKK
ncbi:hypothetical protein niasHS_016878 [Heterodera schachtii]|uniref:Guanylate cyclase domain-containing protein n=1 Tax=Heterodera schachtii TaxID=97005 RepID=A0ABD2HQI0_HETSC